MTGEMFIGHTRYSTFKNIIKLMDNVMSLVHLLRFGKQKLLMTTYFTPELHHQENWFQLTLLAYVNLWTARKLAISS